MRGATLTALSTAAVIVAIIGLSLATARLIGGLLDDYDRAAAAALPAPVGASDAAAGAQRTGAATKRGVGVTRHHHVLLLREVRARMYGVPWMQAVMRGPDPSAAAPPAAILRDGLG